MSHNHESILIPITGDIGGGIMRITAARQAGLYNARRRHRHSHLPNHRKAVNFAAARLDIARIVTAREADAAFTISFWQRVGVGNWPTDPIRPFFQLDTGGNESMGWYGYQDGGSGELRYYIETVDTGFANSMASSLLVTDAEGPWHHFMVAGKTNFGAGLKTFQVYDGDTDVSFVTDANGAFTTLYNGVPFRINEGTVAGVAQPKLDFDIAELWLGLEYLDISDAAVRAKFRDAHDKPADLGDFGQLPTGKRPEIYLSGDKNTFWRNKGLSEDGEITGTLANATSSPWD